MWQKSYQPKRRFIKSIPVAVLEVDDAVRVVDHGPDDADRVGQDVGLGLRDAHQAVRVLAEVELAPGTGL
jgi:hypothetical protein